MSKKKYIQKSREVIKVSSKVEKLPKVTKRPYLQEEEDMRILYKTLGYS